MRNAVPSLSWRLSWSASLVCSLVSQMILWASPAQAQAFLLDLLGMGSSTQVNQRPVAPPARLLPRNATDLAPNAYRVVPSAQYEDTGPRSVPPAGSGSYTTVCVRMCDGYYFPISFRATRGRFHNDADACRARCPQSEAKLFYHSSTGSGANMTHAVDLTGRGYANLPIAFMHRKSRVAGCTCQPEPWSSAAAARHDNYAVAEGRLDPRQARRPGSMSVVAGNYASEPPRSTARTDLSAPASTSAEPATPPHNDDAASAAPTTAQSESRPDTTEPRLTAAEPIAGPQRLKPRNASPVRTSRKPATTATRTAQAPRQPVRSTPMGPRAQLVASSKMVWPGDQPTRTR